MTKIHRLLPLIGLGAALLVVGCSTTIGGSAVAGTSPAGTSAAATQSPPSGSGSGSSTADTAGSTLAIPDLGSTATPIPPIPVSSGSDAGTGRTTATTPSTPPASSTSQPPSTTTTPSSPAAGADPFAGATQVDPGKFTGTVTPIGFSSPSGNIACGFQPTQTPSVVCQIEHHTYPNPSSQDCHGAGATGAAVTLSAGGAAEFLCAGDVEGGGPTLAYGSAIKVSGLECVSRESGVSCRDTATGNGFRLATASYELRNGGHTTGATAPAATTSSFSRFAGTWGGHGRALDVTAAGKGTVSYRSYVWCSDNPNPPCDSMKNNQIVAGGKLTVTLTAASGSTGTGTITASDDPAYPTGTRVTATVSGYNLTLSIWPDAPFCAANTPSAQWNCGA